jgi:TetR/AcrR family transcriptional regulator
MGNGSSSSIRVGRQARSVQTKQAILRAAERMFAESGMAGARTDAIAEAAGVNKALLYYYFKSKQQLYEAVIEEHFREFNEQALHTLRSPGSARKILLRYVSVHFDFICEHRRHALLHQQMVMNGGKSLQKIVRDYFLPRGMALDELLERGMRAGEFRRADRRHAAVSIVALIVFYFSAAQVMQLLGYSDVFSDATLRKRKREVLDFVRHGLFSDAKAELA